MPSFLDPDGNPILRLTASCLILPEALASNT
jgi:hypothetical protein